MAEGKWTVADIPDQSGRVAVVTGSNTGLGLETARELAAKGAHVVLAVRNTDKGERAMADILAGAPDADLELVQLDLASLDSVRAAAEVLLTNHGAIDVLVNNAGLMYTKWATTDDGFELQMGVNHLGHFALTNHLLERIMATDGSRIVNVSSIGHKILSKLDPNTMMSGDRYNRIAAYGRSKLANLLFTYELQRRLTAAGSSTVAVVAHPGGSSSELARNSPAVVQMLARLARPVTQGADMGALPQLRAATDPAVIGGQYYGPDGWGEAGGHPVLVASSARSHSTALQTELWAKSEELTGETYDI